MQAQVRTKSKWLIIFPVLVGIMILVLLLKTRVEPEQTSPAEQARPVRIIEVPSVVAVPRALG